MDRVRALLDSKGHHVCMIKCQGTVLEADIEQVQKEKKPFTLRCIPGRTTLRDSGEVHRWQQSMSNVWITWGCLLLP